MLPYQWTSVVKTEGELFDIFVKEIGCMSDFTFSEKMIQRTNSNRSETTDTVC